MDYNKLDEEYWKIEKNMIIQSKLFDMNYRQKKQLEAEKKINQRDMNEAAKYKLLNGWSYTNEQGIKIIVAPQKYFTDYTWLNESQCQELGVDWNNINSPLDIIKADEFYDKYFNRSIREKKIKEYKEKKKDPFTPYIE